MLLLILLSLTPLLPYRTVANVVYCIYNNVMGTVSKQIYKRQMLKMSHRA